MFCVKQAVTVPDSTQNRRVPANMAQLADFPTDEEINQLVERLGEVTQRWGKFPDSEGNGDAISSPAGPLDP